GQLVEAAALDGRDRDDGRSRERRALEGRGHLRGDHLEPFRIDQVDLRERDHAAAYLEQVDDLEVLAGLGPHALVGGHDQDHGVDAVHAGEHVADEPRVTGNIHDPDLATAGQPQVAEAEVDGHAAALFLGE